jgi:hypothetical protein
VKVLFDPDAVTLNALIDLEEAGDTKSLRITRDILSRFARDEQGGKLSPEAFGELPLGRVLELKDEILKYASKQTGAPSGEAEGGSLPP